MTTASMAPDQSSAVIDEFMRDYEREMVHYELLEQFVKGACEEKLTLYHDLKGVKAYVSSRIKSYSSLKTKLVHRHHNGEVFDSPKAIRQKIMDILGIRISVYFPNSIPSVHALIREAFDVQEERDHPEPEDEMKSKSTPHDLNGRCPPAKIYVNRFPGYRAKHFRVTLRNQDKSAVKGYRDEVFEIQVASAISQVWSEVQHGIIYKIAKDLDRQPTDEELRILDSLTGLVQTGEVILDQLKHVQDTRDNPSDTFGNQYELGSFLMNLVPSRLVKAGSIPVLYKFLGVFGKNTRSYLAPRISKFDFKEESQNISQEIIKQEFASFDLSASIYVMTDVLSKLDEAAIEFRIDKARHKCIERALERANVHRDSDQGDFPGLYECTVVISSLIWLEELFLPNTDVLKMILEHFGSDRQKQESLKWVLESVMPTNILLLHQPSGRDLRMLDALWTTFESSTENVFKFVFKIAKTGVWRDLPEDILLLERMRTSLSGLSPELLRSPSSRSLNLASHGWSNL